MSCNNLRSVSFDTVEGFKNSNINSCSSLVSVTLPADLKKIASNFGGCYSLRIINFKGTEEQWNNIEKGEFSILPSTTINFNYAGV